MKKQELRKIYLEKRKQLPLEDRTLMSRRIAELFFDQIYTEGVGHIHLFLPISKFNEVDTWVFVEEIKSRKLPIRIVISKSDMNSGVITNYYYDPQARLLDNKWGIPEPETGEICDNLLIDAVLVPLLAFDKNGHRIGYGKGFYDRFLINCRKDAIKVGLSYEGPVDLIEDAGENDVVLDCAITPEKIHWFKK
jgi:5-formyltetrahydrofolate cyclo-ligase